MDGIRMKMEIMKNVTNLLHFCNQTTPGLLIFSVRFISFINRLVFMVKVLIKRRGAALKEKSYLLSTFATTNVVQ